MTAEKVWRYTICCPGFSRWDEDTVKSMRKASGSDKRLHWPHGWESEKFGEMCPECGDLMQQRGSYTVTSIPETE